MKSADVELIRELTRAATAAQITLGFARRMNRGDVAAELITALDRINAGLLAMVPSQRAPEVTS